MSNQSPSTRGRKPAATMSMRSVDHPIILYGAGFCGIMVMELLRKTGVTPLCFFDGNGAKQGTLIDGIPVTAACPRPQASDPLVIVCMLEKSGAYAQIKTALEQMGYSQVHHILEFRDDAQLFRHQPLVIHPDHESILENADSIHLVEQMLDDTLSKQTYQSVFRFLREGPDVEIPTFPLAMQYFQDDVYLPVPEEVFIDCGAFKGDTLKDFMQHRDGRYGQYVAIEPLAAYAGVLDRQANRLGVDRIRIMQCALSDEKGTLRMHDYGGENAIVMETGESAVPCDRLDALLAGCKPTMIKIDIEGYEKRALAGAVSTIRTHRPVLAIAIYHHTEDLWEIPMQIRHDYPWYSLHVRSYMNLAETVLYAVPTNRRAR